VVAADLKRDPKLEAAVQRRQQEFGIKPGECLDRMMREQGTAAVSSRASSATGGIVLAGRL
jgi:hypothetical protein